MAPCAAPAITDDKGFTTDRATQEAGVDLAAGIIDGVLRARNPATHEVQTLRQHPERLEPDL